MGGRNMKIRFELETSKGTRFGVVDTLTSLGDAWVHVVELRYIDNEGNPKTLYGSYSDHNKEDDYDKLSEIFSDVFGDEIEKALEENI